MLSRAESSQIHVVAKRFIKTRTSDHWTTSTTLQHLRQLDTHISHRKKYNIHKYVFMCILFHQRCFVMILSFLMFVTNRRHHFSKFVMLQVKCRTEITNRGHFIDVFHFFSCGLLFIPVLGYLCVSGFV